MAFIAARPPRTPTRNTPARSAAAIASFGLGDDRAAGDDRDAGKAGARGVFQCSPSDGRQIEAPVLSGLRRLDQDADAARRRHAPLCPQLGHPGKHIVGAFGRLDRDDAVVGDNRALPHVEWTERRDDVECARDVVPVALHRGARAEHAFGNKDLGRQFVEADDAQPILFEYARDPGQQTVVAAPKRQRQPPHQFDGEPIQADARDRRAQQRPDEHGLSAPFGTGEANKPPRLPERHPMMRIRPNDFGIGPAFDAEHHRPAAPAFGGGGDGGGQAAAAADDRDRIARAMVRLCRHRA